jgi:hypothetical protein
VNDPHDKPGALVDWDRSACLCDVGLPGYAAAVCVTRNGTDVLWLIDSDELDTEHPRCGNPDQPHECLGPLPLEYVQRLTIAHRRGYRCGRRTRSGTVCRMRVSQPGAACEWHRDTTPERTSHHHA